MKYEQEKCVSTTKWGRPENAGIDKKNRPLVHNQLRFQNGPLLLQQKNLLRCGYTGAHTGNLRVPVNSRTDRLATTYHAIIWHTSFICVERA